MILEGSARVRNQSATKCEQKKKLAVNIHRPFEKIEKLAQKVNFFHIDAFFKQKS
jgi:hypothetical protein